jgi:hypothetical protein
MTELLTLLVAHHIADVWGQPSWLIEAKKSHLWAIFEHVMIYAGVLSATLMWMESFQLWMFWFFLIGHFVIDTFFYQVLPVLRNEEKQYWYVYPDQALHYAQIVVLLWLV